jgi:two-component system nitrate/nitrite response regulator NarL
MHQKIRVTILDDHQGIIDGYAYRLSKFPNLEVAATISFGKDLEPTLATCHTDVLLLDVTVPTAPDNSNPYPILYEIPRILQLYPCIGILVISMHAERSLIRAVMEAGANGYILKDDQAAIKDLASIVISVANGGIFFSQKAHQLLLKYYTMDNSDALTHRQLEVLSLCAAYPNYSTEELAQKLAISNSTVRNLLSGAYLKLGVHTRAAAIAKARDTGLITPYSQAI